MLTPEHIALQDSVRQFIAREITPHIDEWEAAEIFPAHDIFKKLGNAGFLGVIGAGGVGRALAVQTDMATPALARFGSDELRERFLKPTVAGDYVVCLGVSEAGAGSDV